MSAPTVLLNGHVLALDSLVCSCGEWAAEGREAEFRRLAFECWKVHAGVPVLEVAS